MLLVCVPAVIAAYSRGDEEIGEMEYLRNRFDDVARGFLEPTHGATSALR
jgi:hypothetical protein